jgi:hypothetical protein
MKPHGPRRAWLTAARRPARCAKCLQMSKQEKCRCDKPLLQERSEQKGSSVSRCGRCKRPLDLRPSVFRSAFA